MEKIPRGLRQMPSAMSASISEITASFNCIIMASEVARGLSVITSHAVSLSPSPLLSSNPHIRFFSRSSLPPSLPPPRLQANVSDPEATRLVEEKLFLTRRNGEEPTAVWCVWRNNKVSYSSHENGTRKSPLSAYRVIKEFVY